MSFDDEFDELAALAYQTAYRILGSRALSEEVAQDTMVKAYVRWRRVHATDAVDDITVDTGLDLGRLRAIFKTAGTIGSDQVEFYDLNVGLSTDVTADGVMVLIADHTITQAAVDGLLGTAAPGAADQTPADTPGAIDPNPASC